MKERNRKENRYIPSNIAKYISYLTMGQKQTGTVSNETVPVWCPESESNQRHGDFQSPALPTELSGQMIIGPSGPIILATQKGLEPSTSSVTGWHSNQLNYCAMMVEDTGLEPVTLCL